MASMEEAIEEFVETQRQLLERELRSEVDKDDDSNVTTSNGNGNTDNNINERKKKKTNRDKENDPSNNVLRNLELSEVSVGLLGRTVVTLISRSSPSSASSSLTNTKGVSSLLPAHRFTVGDAVHILSKKKTKNKTRSSSTPNGVISAVSDTTLSIALHTNSNSKSKLTSRANNNDSDDNNDDDDDDNGDEELLGPSPLTVVPGSSAEVHSKLLRSLDRLRRNGAHADAGLNPAFTVVRSIFCPAAAAATATAATHNDTADQSDFQPFNSNLDDSQIDAVRFALSQHRPVALIHGPPGTGKTTTVAELIHQAVRVHKQKVLVTAPSNVAVDNLLERILSTPNTNSNSKKRRNRQQPKPIRTVRLGHPARIQPTLLRHSLESQVRNSSETQIVNDARSELRTNLALLADPNARPSARRIARREVRLLRKEIRNREENVVLSLLSHAQVVLCTNVGAASHLLDKWSATHTDKSSSSPNASKRAFDLVIIDEAAQALEASCWIPIQRGRRLVLAGDHRQLPPTILSASAAVRSGLGTTLFQKIMDTDMAVDVHDGMDRSRMLRVQYRMHQDIADWASHAMYQGRVETHFSVRSRTLSQLPPQTHPHPNNDNHLNNNNKSSYPIPNISQIPFLLIDTSGCELHETTNPTTGSRHNLGEANLLLQHVNHLLLDLHIHPTDIAVITPYRGQVELLRSLLLPIHPLLEIRTVDGFQGGEREAVVLSLVRSSLSDGVGFLGDERRLNVAITRARRHCAVICDCDTVSRDDFLKGMVKYVRERGVCVSAAEFGVLHEDETVVVSSGVEDLKLEFANIMVEMEQADAVVVPSNPYVTQSGNKNITGPDLHPQPDSHSNEPTSSISPNNNNKDNNNDNTPSKQPPSKSTKSHNRRTDLMDRLATFAEVSEPGEEMQFPTASLSEMDRLVVQELAVQLGLIHRIEYGGGEDSDGDMVSIVVSKRQGGAGRGVASGIAVAGKGALSEDGEEALLSSSLPQSAFSAFARCVQDDDDDDDDDEDDSNLCHLKQEKDIIHNQSPKSNDINVGGDGVEGPNGMNSVLASLAKEREARMRQTKDTPAVSVTAQKKSKKKKKGKKGNKLGGGNTGDGRDGRMKGNQRDDVRSSPNDELLDDMEFLDAQIEKVQTSHGRRVEGSGSGYRSIMNGILISKPPPQEAKRNVRASSVLKSKIQQAQKDRSTKAKKKK